MFLYCVAVPLGSAHHGEDGENDADPEADVSIQQDHTQESCHPYTLGAYGTYIGILQS